MGRLKAAAGLPPYDPECEKVQIARLRALAEEALLDPEFAEKFLNFIIAEAIHHQRLGPPRLGPREHPIEYFAKRAAGHTG